MKVTSWNLLHGQALPPQPGVGDESLQKDQLLLLSQYLAGQAEGGPDLVAFQEVDSGQPRSGHQPQIREIAKHLAAPSWGFARTIVGTPGQEWRKLTEREVALSTNESSGGEGEPSYGVGLVSKIPVTNWHLLQLGRSPIGLPLAVPSEKGVRFLYVKDEPRVALAAELENGFTIAVTHLSFVPLVNLYQLWKVQRWLRKLPGKHFLLMGDLNLPFNIPQRFSSWKSLNPQLTYPAWGAKVQFDYILIDRQSLNALTSEPINFVGIAPVSDHLPITVEINQIPPK